MDRTNKKMRLVMATAQLSAVLVLANRDFGTYEIATQ